MVEYQQRVAGWLEPIGGDLPAGADARYDPVHENIRNQIASLDTPTGPEVDWPEVLKQSQSLLTTASKDLLIACYAAYGLYQLEGLAGLAAGLWLVAELMERFWENGFPPAKRVRARVNACDWLTERLELVLPETPVDANDRGAVEALRAAYERLSEVVSARFEDPAPKMMPLNSAIRRLELTLPPPEAGAPASAAEAQPTAEAEPQPAGAPAQPAVEASPSPPASAPEAAAPASEPAPAEPGDGGGAIDLDARLNEYAAPFLSPISEGAPAGEDTRYDPDNEAVRNEVSQLDLPTGGEVDWVMIQQTCASLLQQKSKDILVATYLAGALFEQKGLGGLGEGLAILTGVLDTFWDTAYPPAKRLRARSNALAWLMARLEPLQSWPVAAGDKEAVLLLEAAAKRYTDVVYERFEDEAPAVRPLLNNVQRLVMSIPEPAPPKPEPAPAQAAAAPPVQQQAAAAAAAPSPPRPASSAKPVDMPEATAEFAGVSALDPFLKKVGTSLQKAAREVFKVDPANPAAYRLSRLGLLLHLDEPPPVTSGQQTAVPPPRQEQVGQLEALAGNQNWAPLLEEAESAFGANRIWLDTHRYVAMALGGLGYAAARKAVIAAAADILNRLPELRDLQFNNGLPFASGATKQWIDDEVIVKAAGGGGGAGLNEEEQKVLDDARGLVGGGKISEAVALLDTMSSSARSASVGFRARLAAAQACVVGGSPSVADGIFSALHREIDEYKLEQWDPDLVAGCYKAHYEVLKSMANKASEGMTRDPSLTEKLSRVYARLCRVSPATALKLGS